MKIIDCQQGTAEWKQARCGVVTASCLDKIITPSTGKLSAAAPKYLARLAAEWFIGEPMEDYVSPYMVRGTDLEAEARLWYSFDSGHDVQQVGFIVRDDGLVGCSPDGLIGDDGGLELKNPGIEQHMVYVLNDRLLVSDYRTQVQGCMFVTGRKWWDLCSFSPVLPSIRVRVERDEEFIAAMAAAVDQFVERLEEAKRKLAPMKAERDRSLAAAMETAEASHGF